MAAHKLPRLSKSILDKPQLITTEKFREVADVLENRSEYLKAYSEDAFFDIDMEDGESVESQCGEDVGVLRIEGPTTYKKTGWEALCGGCSYANLIQQMNTFVEEGKKTVLMWVDSPGGQAYRMMFTARELRRLADENDIRLIAYVDGMSASAGYGLSAAAHEIIGNLESEIGSIGVVISLMDQSKALEDAGYKRVFVTAGESKVPFDTDGSFKETFLAELQENVDGLYTKFVEHVATMRGISEETVRSTEAKVFKAEKALELGLVDKLMEEPELYEYLESLSCGKDKKKKQTINPTVPLKENLMSENVDMAQFKAMAAELATLKAEKELTATETKKAELTESLSSATYLSDVEGVVGFLMEADDAQSAMFNTILGDASAALTAQAEEASTKLEEVKEEFTVELNESKEKLSKAEVEKEELKSEFSKPDAIRDEEKEENLQALSHKEKLARAVEAAKAKQA